MKRTVLILLSLSLNLFLIAQNYTTNELIVEYVLGTPEFEKQATRDFYQVNTYNEVARDVEIWRGITFPFVLDDENSSSIQSIEELLGYILNQSRGNGSGNSSRGNIQDGNLNYLVNLNYDDFDYGNGTFDPLPLCPDGLNSHLIGPSPIWPREQFAPKIMILDQLITINEDVIVIDPESFEITSYNEFIDGENNNRFTGQHGNLVCSTITNVLDQSHTSATIINFPIFNGNGVAYYDQVLNALQFFSGNSDPFFRTDLILNFSAIMFPNEEEVSILSHKLQEVIERNNLLLVASAGNFGWEDANVFPASLEHPNKIGVAGTTSCMELPSSISNSNTSDFEIATSAEHILAQSSSGYRLVGGTSFSAAFVTSAAAQVAYRWAGRFLPEAIKLVLLDHADRVPALNSLCQEGRLLNVTETIANIPSGPFAEDENRGLRTTNTTTSSASAKPATLEASPNPFPNQSQVNISVGAHQTASLQLLNAQGQIINQQSWLASPYEQNIRWETPAQLAPGMYFLRVYSGQEEIQQLNLVKM